MIRRLHSPRRVDRIDHDPRPISSRIGKWVYLGLLFLFFLWLADLFVGPLLRLEADGLVVSERVSVGVPFTAQVKEIATVPGAEVHRGQVLARVDSVDLSVGIAGLAARNAELLTKRADLEQKVRTAEAVLPIARDRAQQADSALDRLREVREDGRVALATWSQALAERYVANERVAELQAETIASASSLAALDSALADAKRALAELAAAWGSGVVRAIDDGIVGLSMARPGDVVTVGQPLMVVYKPPRQVLAYLETGTLYSVAPGDRVRISDGFHRTEGRVLDVLPVAEQLPEEFRKIFQPRGRSQVARVALDDDTAFPLFTKVRLSGIGWLSPGTVGRERLAQLLGETGTAPRSHEPGDD